MAISCPVEEFTNGHTINASGPFIGSSSLPCRMQIIPLQCAFEQIIAKGWLRTTTLSHVITGRYSCIQVWQGSSFVLGVEDFTVSQPLRWAFGYYAVC
jgi:hypothetical protein